jgi:hypothetical protein
LKSHRQKEGSDEHLYSSAAIMAAPLAMAALAVGGTVAFGDQLVNSLDSSVDRRRSRWRSRSVERPQQCL